MATDKESAPFVPSSEANRDSSPKFDRSWLEDEAVVVVVVVTALPSGVFSSSGSILDRLDCDMLLNCMTVGEALYCPRCNEAWLGVYKSSSVSSSSSSSSTRP